MSTMNRRTLLGHTMSGLTLVIAFVMFFPILWMVMTSFKTEADAFTSPPLLVFTPTFENYANALQGSRYFNSLVNTGVIVLFSTLLALTLGVPAAYSLAYYPTKRSNFTLSWVMSTRMLPAVGVVVPLYVIFKNLGLFDTHLGLILLYTTANLPLVIWMMHSFLSDLPYEILEAGRMDVATLSQEVF